VSPLQADCYAINEMVRAKFWRSFIADDSQNAVKYLKAHLTTYTACLDVERLCILLTERTCRFYVIFGLISNYFPTQI